VKDRLKKGERTYL